MFNQLELSTYYEQENISYEAQLAINNIRRSNPSRRTASGTFNVACRYPSKKMRCTIQAESHSNELAALYEWDHDSITHEFYDQPPKIKLQYQKHDLRKVNILHTPDYFVLADGYVGWIECKTEEKLIKLSVSQPERYFKDEFGNWRCPPGEAYAAQLGLKYSLRSSAVNDWTLLRNLVFLSDYLDADCPRPSINQLEIAKGLFKEKPWMNLIDLVRADEALSADAIYKMIVDGDLFFPVRSNPISELEYAIIYRDELAADFYRLQSSKGVITEFDLRMPLQIEIGEKFTWDGIPWKIDNVGKTTVFISSGDGNTSSIQINDFKTYVQESKITGLPANLSQDLQNESYKKICAADPLALQEAVGRYHLIHKSGDKVSIQRSESSIKSYRKRFRESEKLYGNGLIGLFPNTKKRGNRNRKIDENVINLMNEVIVKKHLVPFQPKIKASYGEFAKQCQEQGLLAPSAKTFSAAIKKLNQYDVTLAREGKRAAYEHEIFYWRLDQETPPHGERPFDIAHIDHTQLDIQVGDRLFGIMYERPWLSIMMDAYSRKILAFSISFDPPSYRSCMILIKRCVQQYGRFPRVLVLDGGSEFDSVYLETLLAYLKCTKKSRAKSKARYGAVLERFFGTTNTQLIHNLSGNTQATKTPRKCTPSHDPKTLSAWTLETLHDAYGMWVKEVYESNPHKGLGTSPTRCFEVGMQDFGMREHKHFVYTKDFEILCMPTTKKGEAKVHHVKGIYLNYQSYWCAQFNDPAVSGKQVQVRFDPDNAARAFAYVNGSWVECVSEFASIFTNRSVKQIEFITQDLNAKNKLMGKNQKITAISMAEFLRKATLSENTTRQMWRDQEQLALAAKLAPPIESPKFEIEVVETDVTDDQEFEVYGDF